MTTTLNRVQVRKLFEIRELSEIERFLDELGVDQNTEWKWLPVGGREANATNVELSTEQTPPIIERITNGIDGMLELAHEEFGSEPISPREAAERWFGIPGGSLGVLEDRRGVINRLAPKVRIDVFDSGLEKAPSIAIRDEGIGQHPTDMAGTILSLGASNKIGKHYLCGAYGHGGSSTFAWCPFTVIISRRRPGATDRRPDDVGWTVVRKYDDVSFKINTYQYLADVNGEIPSFASDALNGTRFDYGTYIIHIGYELGKFSALWSIVGFRFLNNLLFDPVLPFAVRDHREPAPQDRYITGTRHRLQGAPLEYRSEFVKPLGEDGELIVRYWVFKEPQRGDSSEDAVNIQSYLEETKSTRTIAITLNGQRHWYLDKSFVKNVCRYPLLAESLLVQVDCDQLSRQRKKDLFPATRVGVKAGEKRLDLIEKCLSEALTSDIELGRIERARLESRLAQLDEKGEQDVRKLLDRLIEVTQLAQGTGSGKKSEGSAGSHKYKAMDPPTVFHFSDQSSAVRIAPGTFRTIDIRTDAPNEIFDRRRRRARLTLESGTPSIVLRRGLLRDGRLSVNVAAQSEAVPGTEVLLRATLEMAPDVFLKTERSCIVIPPPPPYVGIEPPTFLEIVSDKVRLRKRAETIIRLQSDCRDDILSRAEDRATLRIEVSIEDTEVSARRGPNSGSFYVHITVGEDVPVDAEGTIRAVLALADGTNLQSTKPCVIVETPSRGQGSAPERERRPNYEIIPVWREFVEGRNGLTWDDPSLYWSGSNVGRHALSQDKLLLYVNMDHSELNVERARILRSLGVSATDRMQLRYKAYVAYHLWLHHNRESLPAATLERSEEEDALSDDEAEFDAELRRVAKTVLLAMRSEQDLIRQLSAAE